MRRHPVLAGAVIGSAMAKNRQAQQQQQQTVYVQQPTTLVYTDAQGNPTGYATSYQYAPAGAPQPAVVHVPQHQLPPPAPVVVVQQDQAASRKKRIMPMCICSLFLLTVLLCSLFIQFPGRYYYGVLTGSQQVLWTDGVFINQVRFEATASDQLPDLYQYVCSGYPSLVRRTWQQTFDFQPQGSNILNNVGFSVLDDSPLQVSVQNPGSCSLELWVVRGTEQIHSVLTVGEKLGNIPSGNSGIVQFSDTLYRGDYNYVFVNPYDCTADATTHSVFSLNDWEFDPNCSTPICTTSSQMCTVNVNTGTYFYASGPLPANPDQSQSTIGYTGYFYIDGEEWKYWLLYGGLFLGMILSMVITRKMMDMSNPQHSAQNATDDTAPLINPQQQNTTATSYGSSVNAPQVDAPPSYNQL